MKYAARKGKKVVKAAEAVLKVIIELVMFSPS